MLHVVKRELEEGLLGFEVPNLQKAIDLCQNAFASQCEGALRIRHGKECDALELVKIWDTVEGCFFGLGKDRQSLIAVTTHAGPSRGYGWYALDVI